MNSRKSIFATMQVPDPMQARQAREPMARSGYPKHQTPRAAQPAQTT
jgi:hypothetical protein